MVELGALSHSVIIDDESLKPLKLSMELPKLGHSTTLALNLEQADIFIDTEKPDFIIMGESDAHKTVNLLPGTIVILGNKEEDSVSSQKAKMLFERGAENVIGDESLAVTVARINAINRRRIGTLQPTFFGQR
jgi:hypothetical protein